MIERDGSGFELICDHCERAISGFNEFQDAVKRKKDGGWKSVKGGSGWLDLCPDCANPSIISCYKEK